MPVTSRSDLRSRQTVTEVRQSGCVGFLLLEHREAARRFSVERLPFDSALVQFAEQFLKLGVLLSASGLVFTSMFEFHDKSLRFAENIFYSFFVVYFFLIFTLQGELLSVMRPICKLPHGGQFLLPAQGLRSTL